MDSVRHGGQSVLLPGNPFGIELDLTSQDNPTNGTQQSAAVLSQRVLDLAPLALVLVDREGLMLMVNRHASELFGYSPDELVGRSVDTLLPERFRHDHPEKRQAFMAARSEQPVGLGREVVGLGKDGRELPLQLGLTPFLVGTQSYALAALFDISSRLKEEAATRLLADVVNSSSDAIVGVDFDGNVQSWNGGATRVFGYTAEEMCGRHISLLIPPDRRGEEVRLFHQLRDGGSCDHFETVRVAKDGRRIEVSLTMSAIRDRSGQVVGVSGVARDMTEQKRLERQQERFFASSRDLLAVAGLDGFVRKVNGALLQTFGYNKSEFAARPFTELIHPDDLSSVLDAMEQIRNGSSVVGFESRCRTAAGAYRLVRWNVVPDTESGLMYASGRDVTEQREQLRLLAMGRDVGVALAECASMSHMLKECAEAIVRQLDAAFARIWTLPEDGDVLELQASAGLYTHLDGRHSRVPVGMLKVGRIAQERRPILTNDVVTDPLVSDREWARREGLIAFAGHPLVVDDRLVGVVTVFSRHAMSSYVSDALSSIADMIAVGIDRRQADAALARSEAEAQSANKAKSEFLANMSHEIRTPMNGVLGMTRLLLDTELSPKQREYLEMAHRSAESLLGVINDVLDFSKIEAGKLTLDARPFDPTHVAEDAIRDVSVRAYAKRLELTLDMDGQLPEVIIGDPDRLRQVLMNLLGNAIKFTARGEVVLTVRTTSVSANEVELEYAVRDTGIGIAEDHLQRIFTAFEQGDTSIARAYGGTGLGLSISARIVALMGGTLKVESAVAVGSTFRVSVRFPLAHPVAARPPAQEPAFRGHRVLIADDSATHRQAIAAALGRLGMKSECAGGGGEALHALRAAVNAGQPISLLLLDAVMPDLDGFRVAEAILSCHDFDSTAVLMMLPVIEPEAEARCRSLGLASMTKPVMPSSLVAAATNALAGRVPARGRSGATRAAGPSVDAATEQGSRPDEAVAAAASSKRRLRILLAEDNLINQKVAVAMLENAGHAVVVVNNGHQAVESLRTASFDVVLMDVQMPVMDGLQATAAIRALERNAARRTPIIALTAHAMKGDRERLLAAGMDDYVAKPVRPELLFGALERCAGAGEPSPVASDNVPATTSAIDLDALLAVIGSAEVVNDILVMATSELPRQITEMSAARAEHRYDALRTLAHSIKGALSSLAAPAAADVAARLERSCREGAREQIDEALDALRQEVTRVTEAAAQMRTSLASPH